MEELYAECEVDFDYLQELISDINTIKQNISYIDVNDEDYDVSYIAAKDDTRISLLNGLYYKYKKKQYKIAEKPSIRKGSKNFCKFYRKDGVLVRVDIYKKGRIDVVFIAYNERDRLVLFPFSEGGGFYPTYAYATRYEDGNVVEEYSVVSYQIIYERYLKNDDNNVRYLSVNYVPGGVHPVLSTEKGTIFFEPELDYKIEDYVTWSS